MDYLNISKYSICVEGNTGDFEVLLTGYEDEEGLVFVKLKMSSEHEAVPSQISLKWIFPDIDIHSKWNPLALYNRCIGPDWMPSSCKTRATVGAPVHALLNYNGENKLTIAASDTLNTVEIRTGINEESANFHCAVVLFSTPMQSIKQYEIIIRLDTRAIPYYDSLNQVQQWWASMPGLEPADIPEHARLPMYSAWYSFHQHINPSEIIVQCKLAKECGCESIIIDDGWQTDDNSRGYAYCGDWEVAENKVPNMKEFVAAVHSLGMKFLLWYSVPFVGKHSHICEKFKGKFLDSGDADWYILDPRFPEVREYVISTYESAVLEWNLDGLKLDFVDSFNFTEYSAKLTGNGRDYNSLEEAVDALLKETLTRLKRIKSDFIIEFRQSYIGPLMRTYGNMFRAGDCPNDSLSNRVRVIDIRLLSGNTPAHSDMLMWNSSDTIESAAMQVINVLYSVPQISVLLDKIPEQHYKMLKYWLKFWRDNKDILIDGKLAPLHPEANYRTVIASTSKKLIATAYSCPVVTIPQACFEEVILVNGTFEERILVEMKYESRVSSVEVHDCCGDIISTDVICFYKEIRSINVPPAGIIFIKFQL